MASDWIKRHDRLQDEWAVKELRKQGKVAEMKAISPGMRKKITNAERRLKRKGE